MLGWWSEIGGFGSGRRARWEIGVSFVEGGRAIKDGCSGSGFGVDCRELQVRRESVRVLFLGLAV